MHEPTTAVYQVTRTGHDHCDVTEGILLDITPLKVDNQKVVTLYDKDLTLGINLLIGKSQEIITLPFTYKTLFSNPTIDSRTTLIHKKLFDILVEGNLFRRI